MQNQIYQMLRAELQQYDDALVELNEQMDDLYRRLHNQIRIGTCCAIDPAKALVKVKHGENKTPWIKWLAPAAGAIREFRSPSINEQCLLLNYASGDNSSQSMALFGLFSNQFPPPAQQASQHKRIYADGTALTYDQVAHKLRVEMPAGSADFIIPDKITFTTAELYCTGHIKADGEITDHTRAMQADREIYNSHEHPHGEPNTDKPNQAQ